MRIFTRIRPAILISGLLATQMVYANCLDKITPTSPDSRFTIHNDGTVTDNQTGLMWMRCSLGQIWDGASCTGNVTKFTWEEALSTPGHNDFAGFTDWYLPNFRELNSIVELACVHPAINQTVFPDTPSYVYWSSSPSADKFDNILYVDFDSGGDGRVILNDKIMHVRLVRVGQ